MYWSSPALLDFWVSFIHGFSSELHDWDTSCYKYHARGCCWKETTLIIHDFLQPYLASEHPCLQRFWEDWQQLWPHLDDSLRKHPKASEWSFTMSFLCVYLCSLLFRCVVSWGYTITSSSGGAFSTFSSPSSTLYRGASVQSEKTGQMRVSDIKSNGNKCSLNDFEGEKLKTKTETHQKQTNVDINLYLVTIFIVGMWTFFSHPTPISNLKPF